MYNSINKNKMKEVMNIYDYMPYTAHAERSVTRAARALIIAKAAAADSTSPANDEAVDRADAILTNALDAADAIAVMEIEKSRLSKRQSWKN